MWGSPSRNGIGRIFALNYDIFYDFTENQLTKFRVVAETAKEKLFRVAPREE